MNKKDFPKKMFVWDGNESQKQIRMVSGNVKNILPLGGSGYSWMVQDTQNSCRLYENAEEINESGLKSSIVEILETLLYSIKSNNFYGKGGFQTIKENSFFEEDFENMIIYLKNI